MYRVASYVKEHKLQSRDAQDILNEYFPLIEWVNPNNNVVMDIGCGPGDITWNILRPKLPPNTKIIGADISNEMLKYMKENYENIEPLQLDIGSNEIPNHLLGSADQIFSFYCLLWIPNQRQAMQNIFDILKPGGHMLVFYVGNHPIFDVNSKLSKSNKWKAHLQQDVYAGVPPFQNDSNVEETVRNILKQVGFNIKLCEYKNRPTEFSSIAQLKEFIDGVSAYKFKTNDLREEFLTDCANELARKSTRKDKILLANSVITICAQKQQ